MSPKYMIWSLGLYLLSLGSDLSAQNENYRNYLGINASKYLLIFNENSEELDIIYRRYLSDRYVARVSTSLQLSTDDRDVVQYTFRLGLERRLRSEGRWQIYVAGDLDYGYIEVGSSQRTTYEYGLISALGFQYNIGKHFSISTEPGLAFFHRRLTDPTSFNPDADHNWTEVELVNLGQVRVGFHF